MKNILENYRVLDCSIAMAGPFAGQRLGDLGADVIKVEPVSGEWQRHVSAGGARGNQVNVSFLSLNRNKRSLAVDLKSGQGKEILYQLVRNADVFLQNYRPGVAARLGVDYETLSRINPSLVYVSISGYGEDGPYKLRPGQDLLLQGMSGAMMSAGRAGDPPSPAGQYLVDAVTASTAFEGVLAALLHREHTGEGQLVQVNMLDAIVALQMQELSVFSVGKKLQERSQEPHAHVYIRAPYGVFKTADGYITLAFPSMKSLATALDAPELAELDDEKDTFERRDDIYAITREKLLKRPSAEWLKIFDELGVWAGPVYSYEDVVNDPQVQFNGTFVEYEHPTEGPVKTPGFPIKFSRTPSRVARGAPLAGEHTREILMEMGLKESEIEKMLNSRVIGETRLEDRGAAEDHASMHETTGSGT